ncbi:hypothetical protein GH714_036357 [Hevea brasiliensis]|uniref:5-formyltetrahydrofolate cyclo-ligase n=1 Tax=Hevea brasiliensis TaxID=3981 RepID=A0A6A6LLW3_HEVBR|nr:hypothetical protein GH714_036357 [Hevea brasiliensis]
MEGARHQLPSISIQTAQSSDSMFPCSKATAFSLLNKAKQLRKLPSPAPTLSPFSALLRTSVTMNNDAVHSPYLEAIFQLKRSLRSKIHKELKNMGPIKRSQEEDDSQKRKKLYVPLVEDKNSNMRMLKISSVDDLISNSMNILEPALVDSEGNHREDVMQAREPVDLVILPGLAFDRSGNRLGCSGGYCDVFLKKCQDLAAEWKWKQPLLVALAYSLHIMEGGAIPVTPNDV